MDFYSFNGAALCFTLAAVTILFTAAYIRGRIYGGNK